MTCGLLIVMLGLLQPHFGGRQIASNYDLGGWNTNWTLMSQSSEVDVQSVVVDDKLSLRKRAYSTSGHDLKSNPGHDARTGTIHNSSRINDEAIPSTDVGPPPLTDPQLSIGPPSFSAFSLTTSKASSQENNRTKAIRLLITIELHFATSTIPALPRFTGGPEVLSSPPAATTSPSVRHRLYHEPPMAGGRLGNEMFMYAAMLGIANRSNLVGVWPQDSILRSVFKITSLAVTSEELQRDRRTVQEQLASAYDGNLESLSTINADVKVIGFLQSWRYFAAISRDIRREFRFQDSLASGAQSALHQLAVDRSTNDGTRSGQLVFVGVHIRRADLLSGHNVNSGYTVADEAYLKRAVEYLQKQLSSSATSRIVYVVCSDEITWAKTNFPRRLDVVFSEGRTTEQDLALLAACNHTIMTVGTFGWWAGYLSEGMVIYYGTLPNPNTRIGRLFVKDDFFPPEWVAL